MSDGQIDGLVERNVRGSLSVRDSKHCKRNQNSSYTVLRLLHIPSKWMPAPLPRQAATAGPTATSAKDYMLQLAALLSAPDVTQTGRCVSCEQPERGRKFQRLGGGRT